MGVVLSWWEPREAMLIGCTGVAMYSSDLIDIYIFATTRDGEFWEIGPDRKTSSGSNDVLENKMRLRESDFIRVNKVFVVDL